MYIKLHICTCVISTFKLFVIFPCINNPTMRSRVQKYQILRSPNPEGTGIAPQPLRATEIWETKWRTTAINFYYQSLSSHDFQEGTLWCFQFFVSSEKKSVFSSGHVSKIITLATSSTNNQNTCHSEQTSYACPAAGTLSRQRMIEKHSCKAIQPQITGIANILHEVLHW